MRRLIPIGVRRFLHNVFHPSIFPALGGADVLKILKAVRADAEVVTWEWPVELALRYHYQDVLRLTLRYVWRVRPNNGVPLFNSTDDLGAPKDEYVRSHGRLNEKGQARFYAADNPATAILETRPNEGEILTLTAFGFRNYSSAMRMTALIAGSSRYLSPDIDVEIGDVRLRYDDIKLRVEDFDRFMAVDQWIADAITRDVDRADLSGYYPTIAFANMVLRNFGPFRNASGMNGPRAHALLYPSVATKLRAMNICMEPEMAKFTYAPEYSWKLQYAGADLAAVPPTVRVKLLDQSMLIGMSGSVEWGNQSLKQTKARFADALSSKAVIEFV